MVATGLYIGMSSSILYKCDRKHIIGFARDTGPPKNRQKQKRINNLKERLVPVSIICQNRLGTRSGLGEDYLITLLG